MKRVLSSILVILFIILAGCKNTVIIDEPIEITPEEPTILVAHNDALDNQAQPIELSDFTTIEEFVPEVEEVPTEPVIETPVEESVIEVEIPVEPIIEEPIVEPTYVSYVDYYNALPTVVKACVDKYFTIEVVDEINGDPSVAGRTSWRDEKIYLRRDCQWCFTHEAGHILDNGRSYCESRLFMPIYEEEKYAFLNVDSTYNAEYHISSSNEYFAQSFAECMNNPVAMQSYCPKTYNFIMALAYADFKAGDNPYSAVSDAYMILLKNS